MDKAAGTKTTMLDNVVLLASRLLLAGIFVHDGQVGLRLAVGERDCRLDADVPARSTNAGARLQCGFFSFGSISPVEETGR